MYEWDYINVDYVFKAVVKGSPNALLHMGLDKGVQGWSDRPCIMGPTSP